MRSEQPRALSHNAIEAELGMTPEARPLLHILSERKAADAVGETKKRLAAAPELMGEA